MNLLRADVVQNPYPHYAALRRAGSVHFLAEHGFWLVLNYEDVVQCLKQPQLFSNSPGQQLDPALVGADPPAHTRVRRIMNPWFSNQSIQSLEDYTRGCAEMLLAQGRAEKEFDIVSGLASPLTESVIGHFLGLSDQEARELRERLRPHKYQLDVASRILEDWAREYLGKLQTSPGGGLCSQLLRKTNAETLTLEEPKAKMLRAAAILAQSLGDSGIVVFTRSGFLAYTLAALRAVGVPIYAFTDDEVLFRQLLLPWGVEPFLMPFCDDPEETIDNALAYLKRRQWCNDSTWLVVITNALAHDRVIDTLQLRQIQPSPSGPGPRSGERESS